MKQINQFYKNSCEYEFRDKRGVFTVDFGISCSNKLQVKRWVDVSNFSDEYQYACRRRYFVIYLLTAIDIGNILSKEKLPYKRNYKVENVEIGSMYGNDGREAWEYGFFRRDLLKLDLEINTNKNYLLIKLDILASKVDKNSLKDPVGDDNLKECFNTEIFENFLISIPKKKMFKLFKIRY